MPHENRIEGGFVQSGKEQCRKVKERSRTMERRGLDGNNHADDDKTVMPVARKATPRATRMMFLLNMGTIGTDGGVQWIGTDGGLKRCKSVAEMNSWKSVGC